MAFDLSTVQAHTARQDRLTDHRSGIIPEKRNTRAPDLRPSGDMRSAARGDSAEELMKTLGLVNKAAESLSDYANKKFEKTEADNADKGSLDQATGHVDVELEQRSKAYRSSVALGRTMTGLQGAIPKLDEDVRALIEHQDDPDLGKRQAEVRQHIDKFFNEFAMDPETGQLRTFLATPEAKRWLAGSMRETRAKLEATALGRIEERFNDEAVTHFSTLLGSQLDAGSVDIVGLRQILPPTLNDDAVRGAIIATFQGKAQQRKDSGHYADAYRTMGQLLGDGEVKGVQLVDIPASASAETTVPGGAPAAASTAPSVKPARVAFDTLASAVMHVESRGNAAAVSPKGAVGTMQTMPGTLRDPGFGVKAATNNSPEELERVGRDYLKAMLKRYNGNYVRALAAYNGGPGNVDKWLAKNPRMSDEDFVASIPFAETKAYVGKVMTRAGIPSGAASTTDDVISDPNFHADPDPLDPVELAKKNPGPSLASQLVGGLALRPEERRKLLEYRDQMGSEIVAQWTRERREKQDQRHGEFMERLSGLGPPATPTEIAEARRRGEITPQATVQLLNTIRADADRARAEANQAEAEADRDRDERERNEAEGIAASLMGPVYSGTRSPGQASQLFAEQSARMNARVRRMVLGALNSEMNGIENLRKNNPAFVTATEQLDDSVERMIANLPAIYRGKKADGSPLVKSRQQMEAEIRLEASKWSRRIAKQAVDTGNVGNLGNEARTGLQTKFRNYYPKPK